MNIASLLIEIIPESSSARKINPVIRYKKLDVMNKSTVFILIDCEFLLFLLYIYGYGNNIDNVCNLTYQVMSGPVTFLKRLHKINDYMW